MRAVCFLAQCPKSHSKSRRHQVWSRKDLAEREPAVDTSDLAGAVVYPEYLTDDSRLTLANVRGAAAHGARTTVVVYSDYLCPYCRRLKPVLDRLREALGERRVKLAAACEAAHGNLRCCRRLHRLGASIGQRSRGGSVTRARRSRDCRPRSARIVSVVSG